MAYPGSIKRLITEFQNRSPMRATSLIITVFGDVVSEHGGTIWLGSLVRALAPLGVDERLVRTSVFRLVKDGWLESHKQGRRSYYQFTPYGLHEYQRAAHRIYDLEKHQWNGNWQLVIPRDIPDAKKEAFRRSLHWQGFRTIAAGVFARPDQDKRELLETIADFGLENRLMLFTGTEDIAPAGAGTRAMVEDNWKLHEVAQKYRAFVKQYSALAKWLKKNTPDPEPAFLARTLLVHDYRKILLQDTALPKALLPPSWPGDTARKLSGEIYIALTEPSIDYITSHLEQTDGPMPAPSAAYFSRFRSQAQSK